MAQYYAITAKQQIEYVGHHGERKWRMDWSTIAGPCSTREEAETQGKAWIEEHHGGGNKAYGDYGIYMNNLTIVPKSRLGQYRIDPDSINMDELYGVGAEDA